MKENLTIYDQFEQGTDLWNLARLGLPTTSCFKTMMSKGTKDAASKTRQRYIDQLVAELFTGNPTETYVNKHMQRGHLWEPDAMLAYQLQSKLPVARVAFIRNNAMMCGTSPDGMVGDDGGVEIKTMMQELMVGFQCNPGIPQEHLPQLYGAMMVTGRKWWDFVAYSPGFDLYVERLHRSESMIDEIKRYLAMFQIELEDRYLKVTRDEETLKAARKKRDAILVERIAEDQTPVNITMDTELIIQGGLH